MKTWKHWSFAGFIAIVGIITAFTACGGDNGTGNRDGKENQTPEASDYRFENLIQVIGSSMEKLSAVTVTQKAGKSNGARTIYYDGSTALPTTLGEYAVTFDVAAAGGWNAVAGLSAGTLNILDIEGELARRGIPNVLDQDGKWTEARRAEILEIMTENIYGVRPADPEDMTYTVEETHPMDGGHTYAVLKITCQLSEVDYPGVKTFSEAEGKFEFNVGCYIPAGKSAAHKVPAIVYISGRPSLNNTDSARVMRKGIAAFVLGYWDIVNDYNDGGASRAEKNIAGIDRMYYGDYRLAFEGSKQEVSNVPRPGDMPATGAASTRGPYDPGTMQFWSWAASRVMDYLETLDYIDMERVGVHGFSRAGSAAMLTGAFDDRFTLVCAASGNSALTRGNPKGGAPIPNHVNTLYIQWYCRNLLTIGRNKDLPFDAHFLIACVAPRKLYTSTHIEDPYNDALSEYLSYYAASKVWEFYPETKGFICADRAPEIGDKFHEGDIGYMLKGGTHTFDADDWENFLDFLSKTE
jgi:hypothetical protein